MRSEIMRRSAWATSAMMPTTISLASGMSAATNLTPSRTIAAARTVAVVVPSPAASADFAHHLRAHVLELVVELDLLGDSDAVLGDAGSAERLVEDDVAALGAERHLDRSRNARVLAALHISL